MADSYFKNMISSEGELSLEIVASKLSYFYEQLHLLHWQTKSYAEHKATGKLYTYVYEFKDEVMEKLMGYTGRRIKAFKIDSLLDNVSCENLLSQIEIFSQQLIAWSCMNKYSDVEGMAQMLSGEVAKTKYLLTLT
jgi:hypothetical protein